MDNFSFVNKAVIISSQASLTLVSLLPATSGVRVPVILLCLLISIHFYASFPDSFYKCRGATQLLITTQSVSIISSFLTAQTPPPSLLTYFLFPSSQPPPPSPPLHSTPTNSATPQPEEGAPVDTRPTSGLPPDGAPRPLVRNVRTMSL